MTSYRIYYYSVKELEALEGTDDYEAMEEATYRYMRTLTGDAYDLDRLTAELKKLGYEISAVDSFKLW